MPLGRWSIMTLIKTGLLVRLQPIFKGRMEGLELAFGTAAVSKCKKT